jgi:hypothetical protein
MPFRKGFGFRSRRRRKAAIAGTLAMAVAVVAAISVFAFNSPLTTFEIDGNIYSGEVNATTVTGLDWIDGGPGTGALVCPPYTPPSSGPPPTTASCSPSAVADNPAVDGTATFFRDPLKVDPDPTTFTQGDKENDFASNSITGPVAGPLASDTPWHIVTGSVPPNKDDLFDVLTYTRISGSQSELDLGMLRTNNNGSSHLDFELNRNNWTSGSPDGATCLTNTTGDPNFKCPKRTEGDVLISFEIAPDGSTTERFFVWDLPNGLDAGAGKRGAAGSTTGCDGALAPNKDRPCPWEEIAPPTSTGGVPNIVTSVNSAPITAGPWGSKLPDGTATMSIDTGGWFEAYLDLDALGFAPGCPGFGTASAKSRSSGESVTSSLTDLAGPFPIDLNTCGKITVIKNTDPDNEADFSFSTTGGLMPSTFTLDDDDTLASPSATPDTRVYNQVSPGSYSVTEGSSTTHDLSNVQCTAMGTGTSATPVLADRKANITLGNLGEVTCTFTNVPKVGAIKIHKQSTKTGNPPLAGAVYSIKQGDTVVRSDLTTTLPSGDVCADNLPFGTYTVVETSPPANYGGAANQNVTVDNSATCSDPYVGETVTFSNNPLSRIDVTFTSLAGAGVTAASIECKKGGTRVDPISENGTPDPAFDDTSEAITNLEPGTYDCRVVVDP